VGGPGRRAPQAAAREGGWWCRASRDSWRFKKAEKRGNIRGPHIQMLFLLFVFGMFVLRDVFLTRKMHLQVALFKFLQVDKCGIR
jgi:hypothetical protein